MPEKEDSITLSFFEETLKKVFFSCGRTNFQGSESLGDNLSSTLAIVELNLPKSVLLLFRLLHDLFCDHSANLELVVAIIIFPNSLHQFLNLTLPNDCNLIPSGHGTRHELEFSLTGGSL